MEAERARIEIDISGLIAEAIRAVGGAFDMANDVGGNRANQRRRA